MSVTVSNIREVELYRRSFVRATVLIELREYDLGPPAKLPTSEAETVSVEVLVPEKQLGSHEMQEVERASVTRALRLCEAAVNSLSPS